MKIPWVYQHCPKRWIRTLDWISIVVGGIGAYIYMLGGFWAIVVAPLFLSVEHPKALISQPILWLVKNTDRDLFMLIYIPCQIFIALILLYGMNLFDYLRICGARLEQKEVGQIINKEAVQGGADQPATAPELKSEGKDKSHPESKVAPPVAGGRPLTSGRKIMHAKLTKQSWLTREWELSTGERIFRIAYDGRGIGYESILVDGERVLMVVSRIWYVPQFKFDVHGASFIVDVRVWPWFVIRAIRLSSSEDVVYSEGNFRR